MRYLIWFVAALIVLFPALALTVHGAANICFFLMALSGILAMTFRHKPMGASFGETYKAYWPVNVAMMGMFMAILANQIATGHFAARDYDSSLRLALFPIVFWALLMVPGKNMKYLAWGLVAGALLAFSKMYYLINAGVDRTGIGDFISIIPYSGMAMLLGVFAAFSIGWDRGRNRMLVIPKVLALFAGLYGAYLSQTRGTWIAIPVIGGIAFWVCRIRRSYKLAALLLTFVLLGGALCFGNIAQQRIADAKNDVSAYLQGTNRDTSIGLRFQMWHGSWVLFSEHPLFGVGRGNFSKSLDELASRNIISPEAAHVGHGHTHNEMLFNMAAFGLTGLCALLLTYFVPAGYFLKAARDPDREIRWVGGMGLSLCLGFFLFGLTDVQFLWGHCTVFYSAHAALFLAYIVKRKALLREETVSATRNGKAPLVNVSATS